MLQIRRRPRGLFLSLTSPRHSHQVGFTYPDAPSRSPPFKVVICLASGVFMPGARPGVAGCLPALSLQITVLWFRVCAYTLAARCLNIELFAVVLSDSSVRVEMDISLCDSQRSRLSHLSTDAPRSIMLPPPPHFYVNLKSKLQGEKKKNVRVWLCVLILLS